MGTNGALRSSCFFVLITVTIVFGVGYNLYQESRLADDEVILVKREFEDSEEINRRETTEDEPRRVN